jgi:hypothetical protein
VVVPSCRDAAGTLLVLLYKSMYDGRWGSATSPEPRARVSAAYRYSSIPAAIEWRYVGDGRARSNGGGAASHPSVRPSGLPQPTVGAAACRPGRAKAEAARPLAACVRDRDAAGNILATAHKARTPRATELIGPAGSRGTRGAGRTARGSACGRQHAKLPLVGSCWVCERASVKATAHRVAGREKRTRDGWWGPSIGCRAR